MGTGVEKRHDPRDSATDILVIEDSLHLREALSQQVSGLGHRPYAVASCEEARQAIKGRSFAVALVDIGLPDGRGLDLLPELCAADPHTVAVMLTGEQDAESVVGALRGGAFDYLMKPVSLVTLTGGLQRALAHHGLLRERTTLTNLLREERDQLKDKIAAATADIRAYAAVCERSKNLFHTLVRLSALSTGFHSDEQLVQALFRGVQAHVPLRCLALCDVAQREFLGAVEVDGDVQVVLSNAAIQQNSLDAALADSEPELLTRYWVQRHTGIDTSRVQTHIVRRVFWGQSSCLIAFYLDPLHKLDEQEREFLEMCANYLAFEWQRSRLLLHAAQHASLGNVAVEMTKSFLQALTAMRAAADCLDETNPSEEVQDGLRIIARNIDFLTNYIRGFHELSHTREDTVETVSLDEYIDHTLEVLAMAINTRGIVVNKDFQTDSRCVLLNGVALSRTFLDLISSAMRTIQPGGQLYIGLAARDEDGIECTLAHRVTDQELFGISREGLDESATELVKAHPSFLLAQRTVQSCGGKLIMERNEDDLNTFRVLLPRNALHAPLVEEQIG